MKSAIAAIPLLLVGSSMAVPLEKRACPNIHIFGARETTAPAGYGSAGTVVNLILNAHPGSTAEVINYPAAGGDSYASSVQAGVKAVTNQINSFAASCPNTQLVYVGYSQGAQIGDDALCGGGDPNQGISSTAATISSSVGSKIKAVIFMGDPRQIPGASYSVGTSKNPGVCIFRSRPSALLTRSSSSIPDLLVLLAPHTQAESRLTAMLPTHTALTETMPPLTKAMAPSTVKLLSSLSTASSPNLASLLETRFHVYEGAIGCKHVGDLNSSNVRFLSFTDVSWSFVCDRKITRLMSFQLQ